MSDQTKLEEYSEMIYEWGSDYTVNGKHVINLIDGFDAAKELITSHETAIRAALEHLDAEAAQYALSSDIAQARAILTAALPPDDA